MSAFSVAAIVIIFGLLRTGRQLSNMITSAPRRLMAGIRIIGIAHIFWIICFIVHECLYTIVLEYQKTPTPWIFLMAVQFFCYGLCASTFAQMLAKDEFSEEGLERFKRNVLVKMQSGTSEGAQVTSVRSATDTLSVFTGSCAAGVCPVLTKVDLKIAKEIAQPIWRNVPNSWSDLFTFPHPVNEWESRGQAGFASMWIILLLLVSALTELKCWWFYIPLIYGFIVRTLAGPRFDPHGWLTVLFLIPALRLTPIYVPGKTADFTQV